MKPNNKHLWKLTHKKISNINFVCENKNNFKYINKSFWKIEKIPFNKKTFINIYDQARIFNNAKIYGKAQLFNNSKVIDNAEVFGNAKIYDDVVISGDSKVYGNCIIQENVWVFDNVEVYGNSVVYGRAWISGKSIICGNAKVNYHISYERIAHEYMTYDFVKQIKQKYSDSFIFKQNKNIVYILKRLSNVCNLTNFTEKKFRTESVKFLEQWDLKTNVWKTMTYEDVCNVEGFNGKYKTDSSLMVDDTIVSCVDYSTDNFTATTGIHYFCDIWEAVNYEVDTNINKIKRDEPTNN